MPLSQVDPYYRAGTATFGATAVVTGQGTAWLTNVEPGDQIFNRLGQMAVVQSVDSNTQITLVAPFAGTAQTAQAYTIYRVPDSVRLENFSQRMVNLLQGGVLTTLGNLDGTNGDKGLMLNGAGSATTFPLTAFGRSLAAAISGAAAYGALGAIPNAQLPSRLGTTGRAIPSNNYDLAFENGFYAGAGASAVNGPPGNAAYGPLLVLGTASSNYMVQLAFFGTAATGVIGYWRGTNNQGGTWSAWTPLHVETGSNANGRYVRLPDGTQICWFSYNIGIITPGAYYDVSGSFPAAFSSTTDLRLFCSVSAVNTGPSATFQRLTKTSVSAWSALATQNVAGTLTFDAMAIGRWF